MEGGGGSATSVQTGQPVPLMWFVCVSLSLCVCECLRVCVREAKEVEGPDRGLGVRQEQRRLLNRLQHQGFSLTLEQNEGTGTFRRGGRGEGGGGRGSTWGESGLFGC